LYSALRENTANGGDMQILLLAVAYTAVN